MISNPFIQQISNANPGASSTPAMTVINPTSNVPGRCIIVICRCASGIIVNSFSDSQGNTYTIDVKTSAASGINMAIGRAPITTQLGTADTITANLSGSVAPFMAAYEYAWIQKVSPVDKSNSTSTLTVTTIASGTSGTLSQPWELVLTACGISATNTLVAPTGFTLRDSGWSGVTQLADQVVDATTAQNPSWTWGGASVNAAAAVATYIINPTNTFNNYTGFNVGDGMSTGEKIR